MPINIGYNFSASDHFFREGTLLYTECYNIQTKEYRKDIESVIDLRMFISTNKGRSYGRRWGTYCIGPEHWEIKGWE
jgi:hypothetical protein